MARFGWGSFDTRTTWEHSSGSYVERKHGEAGYHVWAWDENEDDFGGYVRIATYPTLTQAQKAIEQAITEDD